MTSSASARLLSWCTLVGSLFAAIGAWRFYRVPIELRLSVHEATWQLVPYVFLILISSALLIVLRSRPPHN